MKRIVWNDDFKLGLPAVDSDHRDLVDICNEYIAAALTGAPHQMLSEILDRMIKRTRTHFEAEERMMDRHNYPDLASHKVEHDRLLTQAETLKSRYDHPSPQENEEHMVEEIGDFLETWLLEHIRTNDRPYRPFIMTLV